MIPVYNAVFRNDNTTGAYAISLVNDPAMQDFWVTLSTEEKQRIKEEVITFSAVDDKKNLLLGAVLIPDKKIYRNQNGKEFYMQFSKETVGQIAHDFINKGNQNNATLEHKLNSNDVSFVETWQVADSKIDKSAVYGKEYPTGSWVTMAKVSDEIYKEAQNGTFNGYSIEAIFGLEKVELKTEIEMAKEEVKTSLKDDILNGIKTLLNTQKETEVKLMDEPLEEPKEDATESKEVTREEFDELFDMVKKMQEDAPEEEVVEEEVALSESDKELEELKKLIKDLEVKLSKKPVEEKVIDSPATERVEFKDMSNFEKMEFNKANK